MKNYWLRGGLILAFTDLVAQIILIITINPGTAKIYNIGNEGVGGERFVEFLYTIFAFPALLIEPLLNSLKYLSGGVFISLIVGICVSALGYFIAGAIMGWIYGKITNRNSSIHQ